MQAINLISPSYVGDRLVKFFQDANLGYGGSDIAERAENGVLNHIKQTVPEKIPQTHMELLFKYNIASPRIILNLFRLYFRVNHRTDRKSKMYPVDQHMIKYFGKGIDSKVTLRGEPVKSNHPTEEHLSSLERLQMSYDSVDRGPTVDKRFKSKVPISAFAEIRGDPYLMQLISHYLIRPTSLSEKLLRDIDTASVKQAVQELDAYIKGDSKDPSSKGLLDFHIPVPKKYSNGAYFQQLAEKEKEVGTKLQARKIRDLSKAERSKNPLDTAYELGKRAAMKEANLLLKSSFSSSDESSSSDDSDSDD